LFILLSLTLLAGCNTISKMNSNMEKSNEMIQMNTSAIEHSAEVIQMNTEAVRESTQTLKESKEVIARSSELLENSTQAVKERPYLLPAIFGLILLALFLPSIILFFSYRKLSRKFKLLLEKLKKENP
jgi:predicted PurR-regulated permease PerM